MSRLAVGHPLVSLGGPAGGRARPSHRRPPLAFWQPPKWAGGVHVTTHVGPTQIGVVGVTSRYNFRTSQKYLDAYLPMLETSDTLTKLRI